MAVNLSMLAGAGAQFFDNNGVILSGGLVYTYAAGTTTPQAAYTTSSGSTAHTNPIVLDSAGRVPSGGEIWLTDSVAYKFVLKTYAAVTIGTYDNVPGNASGIYATFAASSGSSLVGYTQGSGGAVPTTVQAKLRESVSVNDFGAVGNGVADDTVAIQAAIIAASQVRFIAGYTYNLTGDILIPANRKLVVEKSATVINTGGRFTAYNVDNVEWQIDGWVKSVSMATAPDKIGWWPFERGFIEWGGNTPATPKSGFWVHGTGKVSGDWTGTPNVSDITNQINRKGIACWNPLNVLVEGIEVFGFNGEAIYALMINAASKNVVFQNNYVHDTRFNALNFNTTACGDGCYIRNNTAKTAYQLETSGGFCTGNTISDMVSCGIFTGAGAGVAPLVISDNTIARSGQHSIGATFASNAAVSQVFIERNISIDPQQYGIFTDYCSQVFIHGNNLYGTGQGPSGCYDIGVNNATSGVVSENTFISHGSSAQDTCVVASNCSYVSVDPVTNVYRRTTGIPGMATGNGVQTIASAAALKLPTLGSIFFVSGTTNVTSIIAEVNNSNHIGREITLIFQSVLTFTDGSNLKLAGNFATAGTYTIKLVCDGTDWYEVCRSVN